MFRRSISSTSIVIARPGGTHLLPRIGLQPFAPAPERLDLRLVEALLREAQRAFTTGGSERDCQQLFHNAPPPVPATDAETGPSMLITSPALRTRSPRGVSGQKFTEPVAFSSTAPTNLRLAPTALRNGFGLLTLRARCMQQRSDGAELVQDRGFETNRSLRQFTRGRRRSAEGGVPRPRDAVRCRLARRASRLARIRPEGGRDGSHGRHGCRAARRAERHGFRHAPGARRGGLRGSAPSPQRIDRPQAGADRALPEHCRHRGRSSVRARARASTSACAAAATTSPVARSSTAR